MPEVIGRIEHIAIYPIKGAGRIEVPRAMLTKHGLAGDRDFAIVRALPSEDGSHQFITQRDKQDESSPSQGLASLTQIRPVAHADGFSLQWQGEQNDSLTIPGYHPGKIIPVRIWDDAVKAVDQGDAAAEWLSDHLGTGVRLAKAGGPFYRQARQNFYSNDNTVHFQDGYPAHWFFKESVEEVSDKAGEEVEWTSFRPNIVAQGSPAQTEQVLFSGQMGDVPFVNAKPCDRCPVTNVDQDTGEVKVGRALKHLARYMRWEKPTGEKVVIFGQNMVMQGEGVINVGDEVVLIDRRNPPLVYGAKV